MKTKEKKLILQSALTELILNSDDKQSVFCPYVEGTEECRLWRVCVRFYQCVLGQTKVDSTEPEAELLEAMNLIATATVTKGGEFQCFDRKLALANHLHMGLLSIEQSSIDNIFRLCIPEVNLYAVLTDEEADISWALELERQLEEDIIAAIPIKARGYFDRDNWISDNKTMANRVETLSVDNIEGKSVVMGKTYFIYKLT